MICHEFKGGIGTASRVTPEDKGGFTVAALVQANYGKREWLRVDGVPVGPLLPGPATGPRAPAGSCIVIVATDAPLAARCGRGLPR